MHLIPRPLEFAPSIGDYKLLTNVDRLYVIRKVIGDDYGISSEAIVKCRRTLLCPQSRRWLLWHFQWIYCEMPTDCISSAMLSVIIVAFPVKLLWNVDELYFVRKVIGDDCGISSEATVKCRWTVFRPQSRRWLLWHFHWSYCEMPTDCIPFESRRWLLWHFHWSYCEMPTDCIPFKSRRWWLCVAMSRSHKLITLASNTTHKIV
jgi:hypothetical protein